jgi:phage anti-repressor protein
MKTLRTIPFANVHMALHQFGVDGADMLSAVDLVMAVTGKNCNHANELLRKLKPARFRRDNFSVVSRARYVTLEHAVELVMVMPGRLARQARRQFADIIVRYLDGDRSMCCEIEANQDMGMIKSCSALASRVAAQVEAPTKAGDKNKVCSKKARQPRQKTICFSKIVREREGTRTGQEALVRISPNGDMLSAADLLRAITGKNSRDTSGVLCKLRPSLFEQSRFHVICNVRYVTFSDAIKLIMVLPGEKVAEVRKQFIDVITRYLNGDQSMCDEIQANHAAGGIASFVANAPPKEPTQGAQG